jgi:hypothetical protein
MAAHPDPRKNMLTDWILHILYTAVRWRFFLVPVFIMLPLLSIAFVRASEQESRRVWLPVAAIPAGIILGVGNFVAGPQLCAVLVHEFGSKAPAIVTGTYATGDSYNDRQVMGHNVLIRTSDGQTVETSFQDDDFNVYPPQNSVYYPQDGDRFNVSHVRRFPTDFVIIMDDDSPWARGLRCADLMSVVREADAKRQFASDSEAFSKSYHDAVQAAQAAGCDTDEDN